MTEWTCKICDRPQKGRLYSVKEMMFGSRDIFDYAQCENCNCLQILKIPENISTYYPKNYYSFSAAKEGKYQGFVGIFNKLAVRAAISKNPLSKLYNVLFPLKRYFVFDDLPLSKTSKILDVGSGDGSKFLFPLAEIGFTSLMGCDPFLKAPIHYENNLIIRKTDIFGVDGKWDYITFHHSFEHIAQPRETMGKVADLLNPSGVCIIRVPTVSSFAWEKYRENWAQLDAPRHFFLHSIESMKIMGIEAGLELIKVEYDSWHLQFTGSEKYLKDIPLREKVDRNLLERIQFKIKKSAFKKKARVLNKESRGDQAAFFFRRIQD